MPDHPPAGHLRLLGGIDDAVPDLAETAISKPVYSRIGLCFGGLGQWGPESAIPGSIRAMGCGDGPVG